MSGPPPVLREERPEDEAAVAELIRAAFVPMAYASGTEAEIVRRLREAGAVTLALVAEAEGRPLGHVVLSPVRIGGRPSRWHALGPLAVEPLRQRQGIGSALVAGALDRLRRGGAEGCVLVGDPAYYGRFGFAPHPGLTAPPYPEEVVLGLSFGPAPPKGVVGFHEAFGADA